MFLSLSPSLSLSPLPSLSKNKMEICLWVGIKNILPIKALFALIVYFSLLILKEMKTFSWAPKSPVNSRHKRLPCLMEKSALEVREKVLYVRTQGQETAWYACKITSSSGLELQGS